MNRYTYRYVYTCTFICNLNEERVSSSFYSGKTNEYTDSPFSTFSASTLMVFFPSFPRSVSGCGVVCSRFRNGKSILLFRCSQCPPLRCFLKDFVCPFASVRILKEECAILRRKDWKFVGWKVSDAMSIFFSCFEGLWNVFKRVLRRYKVSWLVLRYRKVLYGIKSWSERS